MQNDYKLLDRYHLVRSINENRDFIIYEGFDNHNRIGVLVFFLKYSILDFEQFCERYKNLNHTILLKIGDYGLYEKHQFFITELIEFKFLNFNSRINPLKNIEIKALVSHLVDLKRSHIDSNSIVFTSDYIIKTNQGAFKLIPIQPYLVHYIENRQISIFEKNMVRRFLFHESQISYDQITRDYFVGLLFIIIEQFLSQKMIEVLLSKDDYISKLQRELLGKNNELAKLIDDTLKIGDLNIDLLLKYVESNHSKDFSNPNWQIELFEDEISQVFIGLAKNNLFQCLLGEPLSGKTSILTYVINQLKDQGESYVVVKPKYEKNRRHILIFEIIQYFISQNMISANEYAKLPSYYQKYLKNIHQIQLDIKINDQQIYDDTFINISVALIKTIIKSTKLYIIIDDADLLDNESIQFLNDFTFFFRNNNMQIVISSIKSKFHDKLGTLSLSAQEIVNIKNLSRTKIIKLIKEYLNINDIAATNLSKVIIDKTQNNYGRIIDYLNFIKMSDAIKNNMVDQSFQAKLEFVNDVKVIIEQNVEKFSHYKEFLVFFTFISKPIELDLLNDVFQNSQSLNRIIIELTNNHILKEDGFKTNKYLLSSFHVKQVVLQLFDNALITAVIKEFRTHSKLKYHFDYHLASDFMTRFEHYDSAVELLFNYANILIFENLFEKVTEVFNQAYHIIDTKKILIGKSLIKQNLLLQADAFKQLGNFEGELGSLKKYETHAEPDSVDWLNNQLKIYECRLRMDQFSAIEEIYNDNFKNKILSINDMNLTGMYTFLIGQYMINIKNYTEALNHYERVLENNSIDRAISLMTLNAKLHLLEETKQFEYYFSTVDDVINKKHNFYKITDIITFYIKKAKYLFNENKYNECKLVFENAAKKSVDNYLYHFAAECYSYLGAATLLSEKSKLAIDYFKQAHFYYKSVNDIEKSAYMLGSLSVIYKDLGLISKAIETEKIVYQLFEESHNYDELIYSLANLGHTYSLVFDYDSAEKYLTNAVQLAKSIEKFESLCHANLYLSTVFCFREQFTNAEHILLETINLIDKNDSENYIHYIYYKSLLDFKIGHYEDAKMNLSLIIDSDLLKNNRKYHFVFQFLMGSVLVKLEQIKEGEELLQKALMQSIQQDNLIYQLFINIQLYNLYEFTQSDNKEFTLKSILELIKKVLQNIDDPVLKITFLESNQLEKFSDEIKLEHIK